MDFNERLEIIKSSLIWKSYFQWDTINFDFVDYYWKKDNCSIKISSPSTISYKWDDYLIDLPMNAIISNISFDDENISITWKLWAMSSTWKITYDAIIWSLDDLFDKDISIIKVSGNHIRFRKIS